MCKDINIQLISLSLSVTPSGCPIITFIGFLPLFTLETLPFKPFKIRSSIPVNIILIVHRTRNPQHPAAVIGQLLVCFFFHIRTDFVLLCANNTKKCVFWDSLGICWSLWTTTKASDSPTFTGWLTELICDTSTGIWNRRRENQLRGAQQSVWERAKNWNRSYESDTTDNSTYLLLPHTGIGSDIMQLQ